MLYFVQETGTGRVKIGFSAVPAHRVSKIASDSPHPIVYLGFVDGSRADEAALHARLSAFRVHGEWFSAAVLAECRSLCAGQKERIYPRASDPKRPRRMARVIEDCRSKWELLNVVGWMKVAAAMGMTRGEFMRWRDRQWRTVEGRYGFETTEWERLMQAVPGLTVEILEQIARGEKADREQMARERLERERQAAA